VFSKTPGTLIYMFTNSPLPFCSPAGIRIQDVAGSDTGCYMACFAHDYFRLRAHDPDDIPYVLNDLGCLSFPPKMPWRVSR